MTKLPIGQCKLCLQTRELQDSHLLPAALYRQARLDGVPNPNPTLVTRRGRVQTSKAIKDYVLCHSCEQVFNRNGERYTMAQVVQKGGRSFPLLKTLLAGQQTKEAFGAIFYGKDVSPTIERDKLGYFALSVFWRAGAQSWHSPLGVVDKIDLGVHQEELRRYLLGEASFPTQALLYFVVCSDAFSQNRFYTASKSSHSGNTTTHAFQARGLNFLLMTGEHPSETLATLCFMTGHDRWIMVRDCQDMVAGAQNRLEAEAEIAKLIQDSRRS
jgi:hypothetical protein